MLVSKDETIHSFLILQYKEIDFLIDRNQFSASTSIDRIKQIRSPFPYLDSYSWYNKQKLLLFNFHKYIQDLYECKESGHSKLCLIMKNNDFTKRGQLILNKLLSKNTRLSQEYLGIIITSQAEIHEVILDEIYLNPNGLNPLLNKNGLYGCRFPQKDRIQYFIDLQINIIDTLTRKAHANPVS